MLDIIREKIRALVGDFIKTGFQTFTYTVSPVFVIAECNVTEIISVLVNDVPLGSGEYSFDFDTKQLTLTTTLNVNDNIEANYKHNKYSDTILTEYIRASLVWISIYDYTDGDFELEADDIYPTPTNKETDLFAIIASILIKPDYLDYKLPNISVKYPDHSSKEDRIEDLINQFKHGVGAIGTVEWYTV